MHSKAHIRSNFSKYWKLEGSKPQLVVSQKSLISVEFLAVLRQLQSAKIPEFLHSQAFFTSPGKGVPAKKMAVLTSARASHLKNSDHGLLIYKCLITVYTLPTFIDGHAAILQLIGLPSGSNSEKHCY
jgi:hypothetical protein